MYTQALILFLSGASTRMQLILVCLFLDRCGMAQPTGTKCQLHDYMYLGILLYSTLATLELLLY